MDKLPSWLPAEPLLLRLVMHVDMKKVWKSLALKTDDANMLIDYIEFIRLHPAHQGITADPFKSQVTI